MCVTRHISPATLNFLKENTHHMWVFCYFGNQLRPCDIISTNRRCLNVNVFKTKQKWCDENVWWTTSISGRGKKLLLLQLFWVQLLSPPGWTPRSCCRLLSWGWAAEPTFWPAEERKRFGMSRRDYRHSWRLQLTVLHFSISVLISGLTFSISSTRLALLFIIPPGMTKTLVPPTDKTDPGWGKLESFSRHSECLTFINWDDCSDPCLPHLHLPAFSFWHFAMKQKRISYRCTRA